MGSFDCRYRSWPLLAKKKKKRRGWFIYCEEMKQEQKSKYSQAVLCSKQKIGKAVILSKAGFACYSFFSFAPLSHLFWLSSLFLASISLPSFLHWGSLGQSSHPYPIIVSQVIPHQDNLRCIIFAITGHWPKFICISQSVTSERGDSFSSAYIVELGHSSTCWPIFLDQVSIPYLISWSQDLEESYNI